MKYCSIYICWIIIVVIINSLDSGVSNLLLSCCGMNLSMDLCRMNLLLDHCGMNLSLDHCGMNLSIDHNLGHYPSYNIFPTKKANISLTYLKVKVANISRI